VTPSHTSTELVVLVESSLALVHDLAQKKHRTLELT